VIRHAQDRIVLVDDSLVPQLCRVLPEIVDTVEHFVVIGDGDAGLPPNVQRYEDLLAVPLAF